MSKLQYKSHDALVVLAAVCGTDYGCNIRGLGSIKNWRAVKLAEKQVVAAAAANAEAISIQAIIAAYLEQPVVVRAMQQVAERGQVQTDEQIKTNWTDEFNNGIVVFALGNQGNGVTEVEIADCLKTFARGGHLSRPKPSTLKPQVKHNLSPSVLSPNKY